MKYLLLVDFDEFAEYYTQALERSLFRAATRIDFLGLKQELTVKWFRSWEAVDEAWKFLKEHGAETVGIVMEVMLPEGKLFDHHPEARAGISTGIVFYKKIRELFPELPVMFLTRLDIDWPLVTPLFDGKSCIGLKKQDTPPFEFVCEAERFFRLAPAAEAVPVAS